MWVGTVVAPPSTFDPMTLNPSPGQTIVHPVHGTGVVTEPGVVTRDTPDGPAEYVTIEFEADRMRLMVPLADLDESTLRPPMTADEAQEILALLAGEPAKDPGHAGRRRRNESRLMDGEAESLAKVVRSLRALREDRDGTLKYRDKAHLTDAMDRLVAEMAVALGVSEEEARSRIDQATGG